MVDLFNCVTPTEFNVQNAIMEATLTQTQAAEIAHSFGWRGPVAVEQVHEYNHVYRLSNGGEAAYLKTYTKDWYGDDVAATAGCVEHEISAWNVLAAHGLAVPTVLHAAYDCTNPLGRPFVVSRELVGVPLTDAVLTDGRDAALKALGVYLRGMHTITFEKPGYIMPNGPVGGEADGWQHPIWNLAVWQRNVLAGLEHERKHLPGDMYHQLRAEFEQAAILAPAYTPARFAHGDCWARQFFVQQHGWQISGVVDMEVASAGDAESDFVHLFLELALLLPRETRWWEAVFAGYNRVVDRAAFRLRLLGTTEAEFAGIGWSGPRIDRYARLLAADDWKELLRPS